jgi:hypothetical protein
MGRDRKARFDETVPRGTFEAAVQDAATLLAVLKELVREAGAPEVAKMNDPHVLAAAVRDRLRFLEHSPALKTKKQGVAELYVYLDGAKARIVDANGLRPSNGERRKLEAWFYDGAYQIDRSLLRNALFTHAEDARSHASDTVAYDEDECAVYLRDAERAEMIIEALNNGATIVSRPGVEVHEDADEGHVVLSDGSVHVNIHDDELEDVLKALQARKEKLTHKED